MPLNIIDTYLTPNGQLKLGNRPLAVILFHNGKEKYSIYDMDADDKYVNGKIMFRGHFYVTKDGNIFKGRPIEAFGEFGYDDKTKRDFNINAIGICVEGDYTVDLMPSIQMNSIVLLIQYLRNNYNSLKTIYALDELIKNCNNPGELFPMNEIIASVLGVNTQPLRIAPNGLMRYAFEGRTLYYDARKPIEGNDVKKLQKILNLLGFSCNVNGIYDIITRDAVVRFQKSYNLIPDGVVSTDTYSFINKVSMKFYENRVTFNRILFVSYPNYLYGSDVTLLQNRLNLLGYPCNVNGIYDEETESAVKNFQEIHSLCPDGVVGPITWSQITSTNYNFIKRILSYTVPMMYGDDIRLLQQRLTDKGFPTNPSGWFDEVTKQQVMNFQKSYGINPTGIVDEETAQLLFK